MTFRDHYREWRRDQGRFASFVMALINWGFSVD